MVYSVAAHKEGTMANFWSQKGELGGWNPGFTRPFNDWKLYQVCSFLSTIQDKRVLIDEKE